MFRPEIHCQRKGSFPESNNTNKLPTSSEQIPVRMITSGLKAGAKMEKDTPPRKGINSRINGIGFHGFIGTVLFS